MARKSFIGAAPTGIPKHIGKVNNKNIPFDEGFVTVKAYGPDVFFNNRHVATVTTLDILVLLPKDVRIGGVRASHGARLRVGHS